MNDPNKLDTADDAARIVIQNYERSKKICVDPRRDQWKEWYDLYRSLISISDDDLISNIVIPATFATVEDLLPRLVANRPRIECWGRGQEDEPRAAKHRSLLFYDWDILKMAYKLVEYVKSAEIYGTAILKTVWRQKEETRIRRVITEQPRSIFGIPTGGVDRNISFGAVPSLVWNDPWLDILDIDEVYPDPDGRCVDTCAWIIHEVETTIGELKAARKDGAWLYDKAVLEEAERIIGSGLRQEENRIRDHVPTTFASQPQRELDPLKKTVTILEQWEDSRVITVIKDLPQLKPIRNEFNEMGTKPFVRFTPIPDPNQFYGISIPEMMHSLQVELSLLHSLNVDNLMYSVHQMYKVLRTAGINSRNLRFRPGGVVPVKDMGDIQPLEKSYSDFSLYRTSDELRRWVQKVGTTDTFGGMASDFTGRTATEASLLAEASGSRAGLMFQILGNQSLNELGRKWVRMNELFLDEPRTLRILGDEFTTAEYEQIMPEDLLMGSGVDLDVVIDIAATEPMSRQFKLMRAKDMLQSFGAMGLPPNHPVVEYILTELLRAYGKNRPELLLQAPETQAIAAQAAAGGPGPGVDNIGSLAEQLAADLQGGS